MAANPLAIAQRYFEAWNRRDAAVVMATFTEGGTYPDPVAPGPLSGSAIGAYAEGPVAAFPDLSLDFVSAAEHSSGLVAAEWVMKGTNSGSFMGLPATGASIALPAPISSA